MRLLLVSTYELGRQPVHLASPVASLRAAGVDVTAIDIAVEDFHEGLMDGADAVAFSVPMHTAMRLAMPIAEQIRQVAPDLPIAFYGLYAGAGLERTAGTVGATALTGEYEPDLIAWAAGLRQAGHSGGRPNLGIGSFLVPDRSDLAPNDRYAHLEWQGETRQAAAVEASHGCRHRCRHCPVPVVYDGRLRVVGEEVVLSDIAQLVGDGVRHVTFGDPDFLNAPRYSMGILNAAHEAHPQLTFDATVKVEHVLKHRRLLDEMSASGVLFLVSAFETVDAQSLQILDKGHTVADMSAAVALLRGTGIHVRPTWLPFLPWTRLDHIESLMEFLDEHRLWGAIDPVQLAIKLLIPRGSLLEEHPAIVPRLLEYDLEALSWRWEFVDPGAAALQHDLETLAADASDCGRETIDTLSAMRAVIGEHLGRALGPIPDSPPAPRLSESWFCCAEPTAFQASRVGLSIGRSGPSIENDD
jgi:pyruvate-formate lyase-activating enzyme